MLFTNGSRVNNKTRPIIKLIQLIIKHAEHLQFVRHGLNDDISNGVSTESFCTKINLKKKTRVSYLKTIF